MKDGVFSESELSLKRCRDDLSSARVRIRELSVEQRRTKADLDAARDSAAERESSVVTRESALKIEMAKEKAILSGQIDAANKKIKSKLLIAN